MKNLRAYFTKTNLYKGSVAGVATAGTLAVLAGGSVSAMPYLQSSNNYTQTSYSNEHHHNHKHHKHNHRHDSKMRRY